MATPRVTYVEGQRLSAADIRVLFQLGKGSGDQSREGGRAAVTGRLAATRTRFADVELNGPQG